MRIMVVVVILACGWASILSGCNYQASEKKIRETTARGDVIVKELDRYRDDAGVFPATLSDLVPDYLAEIPAPVVGRGWEYTPTDDQRRYQLATDSPGLTTVIYIKHDWDNWGVDTK